MKLSHQLSINSDAVLTFTRRVYCTRIRSVDNRCSRIRSVHNCSVYLSSIIRKNFGLCPILWIADVNGWHLILPFQSSTFNPQIFCHNLIQQYPTIQKSIPLLNAIHSLCPSGSVRLDGCPPPASHGGHMPAKCPLYCLCETMTVPCNCIHKSEVKITWLSRSRSAAQLTE